VFADVTAFDSLVICEVFCKVVCEGVRLGILVDQLADIICMLVGTAFFHCILCARYVVHWFSICCTGGAGNSVDDCCRAALTIEDAFTIFIFECLGAIAVPSLKV